MPGPIETRILAAAGAEQAEMVAEQDALLMSAVATFRKKLASAELTGEELHQAAKLADGWAGLVEQRLELAAREADIVARIIAEVREADIVARIIAEVSPIRTQWMNVLPLQAAKLESLALTMRVTVEILEARAEVARRLAGHSDPEAADTHIPRKVSGD